MNDENFTREVLERLIKIETKIDDLNELRKTAHQANNLSKVNAEKIEKLEGNQKWLTYSIIGAVIIVLIERVFG